MNALLTHCHAAVERRLNRRYIQSVCCLILAVYLVVQTIAFATNKGGRTTFGPYLGPDFATFFVAGSIFDSYAPERLYDVSLHTQLYRTLFPDMPQGTQSPYANAPFFVLPFAVLAHLPYQWAFFTWMLISIGLYFGGLKLLREALDSLPGDAWTTALLLAFSFSPFLIEGLAGGQVSVFGFFWMALALYLERRGYQVLSGAAVALCAYKPTLLVLILPMLVITRRTTVLLGFAIGSLGLAMLSILAVGREGCRNYLDMLLLFLNVSTGAESGLRTWKYVDINSFSRLLTGGHTYVRWAIVYVFMGITLPLLFRTWWKADSNRAEMRGLIWSSAIAWTLVLNVYLGIYDSILIILSVLISSDVLWRTVTVDQSGITSGYKYLLLLLYIVPWITQPVAILTGMQLYTLVISVYGFFLIRLIWRQSLSEPANFSTWKSP